MYPCPFNIQEAIGIQLSPKEEKSVIEGSLKEEDEDVVYMAYVNEKDLMEKLDSITYRNSDN